MIKEMTMYTILCDNCGVSVMENDDYSCLGDKEHVEEKAMDSDWHRDKVKHYCPNCFEFDDNDELVININRTKPN